MTDDAPFSRYSEPFLNPFPDPYPPDPKPKEVEQRAAVQETFSPPLVPQAVPPDFEPDEFEQEFDKNIFKLVLKIIVFIAAVIAAGFLIWFFAKTEPLPSEPIAPAENIGAEIGETTNLIIASKGGQISYQDEDSQILEIIIPAGALNEDKEISVMQIAKGSVTNRYQFVPKGLKFLKPVTVKIPYKENGLKMGETPYDIKLEYQSAPGAEKYLLWYEVDGTEKKLVTQVMGF